MNTPFPIKYGKQLTEVAAVTTVKPFLKGAKCTI